MKVEVLEYEKKYSFELEAVTQLCGQNIMKKSYILESIRRYFSSYKYREGKNKWRDNVKFDEELLGRKHFTVISISNMRDILTMIKWSKESLMAEYVKALMQKFDLQQHLQIINEELEKMFQTMNGDINQLGTLELTYAMTDAWEMIQKTEITGSDQIELEDKDNYELLTIFINLVEKTLENNPQKMIVLIENVDHYISRKEYAKILEKLKRTAHNYNVFFVLSTSLDGYVMCDKDLCPGIKIFGEIDFQMPELERIVEYVKDNYPNNKKMSVEQIQEDIAKIIHRIGQEDYLLDVEENVICKLINKTMMINKKWDDCVSLLEIAFLKA